MLAQYQCDIPGPGCGACEPLHENGYCPLETEDDPQAELLVEAVKRFREAQDGQIHDWYLSNMNRIAHTYGLIGFLKNLLNA